MRTAARTGLLIAGIALAVSLTGCSGAPAAESTSESAPKSDEKSSPSPTATMQSIDEACAIIADEGGALVDEAKEVSASTQNDPEASVAAVQELDQKFQALGEKITNDAVSPVYNSFSDAYSKVAEIAAQGENPDAMDEMQAAIERFVDAGTQIDQTCSQ
ncbi:hypothetical protein [Microbacterium esteraromaticum]|uniref:hypothetical protein n=1 Tax=Microbacterium esteraromaticum TaxID=57043 RepID=UPI00195CC3B1|nr:hypothetical protein [Microbacterium esteraromaticum]MBM7465881.1 ABC-type glycerol-3-phosphate transport system substrate-binding protein [Microbacterium esteraromaticum]